VQFLPPQQFLFIKNKSFTFVEILISLGVILTLLITIVSVLNPQELLRKARDNKRLYELNSLNLILNTLTLENPNAFNNIASNTIYVSFTRYLIYLRFLAF
jgi:hypothetical protein